MKLKNNQTSINLNEVEKENMDFYLKYGFDPNDSSHPNYSDNFNNDKNKYYQNRIRLREEIDMSIRDPTSYTKKLKEILSETKRKFNRNGFFNFSEYMKSDLRRRKEELNSEKIQSRVVRDINHEINQRLSDAIKNIKIDMYAAEKSDYIAKRIVELSKKEGSGESFEVSLYMIDSAENKNPNKVTIRDVALPDYQSVSYDFCNIKKAHHTKKKLKEQKQKIVGWMHSHGSMSTFFSGIDDETTKRNLDRYYTKISLEGILDDLGESDTNSYLPEMRISHSIVINAQNSQNAYRIEITKPIYYLKDGILNKKEEKITLDRVIHDKEKKLEFWPIPILIDSEKRLTQEEKEEIDERILNTVYLIDKKALLKDFVKQNKSNKESKVITDTNHFSPYIRKSNPEIKEKEIMENTPKINVSKEYEGRIDDTNLSEIVRKIEEKNINLVRENENIKNKYSALKDEYQLLEQKVLDLESKQESRYSNFSKNIQEYYTQSLNSNSNEDKLIGKVAKILSGQYRQSIENINQEEDLKYTRIWTWEDRLIAVKEIISSNREVFSKINQNKKNSLKEILNKNRYLKYKHKDKIKEINEIF